VQDRITKEELTLLRGKYKPGTRVKLLQMDDPYTKLKPGDRGSVTGVDDLGSVCVAWDCGSSLSILFDVDLCRIINDEKDKTNNHKSEIEMLTVLQNENKLMPCPRCGKSWLKLPLAHNAWSRYTDVYICVDCGLDEALRDAYGKEPLPFEKWAVMNYEQDI
jgi:hypothetical protein